MWQTDELVTWRSKKKTHLFAVNGFIVAGMVRIDGVGVKVIVDLLAGGHILAHRRRVSLALHNYQQTLVTLMRHMVLHFQHGQYPMTCAHAPHPKNMEAESFRLIVKKDPLDENYSLHCCRMALVGGSNPKCGKWSVRSRFPFALQR